VASGAAGTRAGRVGPALEITPGTRATVRAPADQREVPTLVRTQIEGAIDAQIRGAIEAQIGGRRPIDGRTRGVHDDGGVRDERRIGSRPIGDGGAVGSTERFTGVRGGQVLVESKHPVAAGGHEHCHEPDEPRQGRHL
jgi:hypothetical protein